MGLLSWLFPSPADRLKKARKLLSEGRFAEARMQVLDVELDGAAEVLAEAHSGLVKVNLERALGQARAGNARQMEGHLELAERFATEADAPLIAEYRERMSSAADRNAAVAAWKDLRAAARRRQDLGVDPGDFTLVALNGDGAVQLAFDENDPLGLPHLVVQPNAATFKPAGVTAPDDPDALTDNELDRCVGALRALYPGTLAPQVDTGGRALARGVLQQVAGRPEQAVLSLLELPEDNAVARFELGRAACALGQHAAAERALSDFGDLAGHQPVGDVHSALLLAEVIAWTGGKERALEMVRAVRKDSDRRGAHLFVALATETGHLVEAKEVLDQLTRRNPKDKRLPQLTAAWTLREAARELGEQFPWVRGEGEPNPKEMKVVQERLGQAMEQVLSNLPAPDA